MTKCDDEPDPIIAITNKVQHLRRACAAHKSTIRDREEDIRKQKTTIRQQANLLKAMMEEARVAKAKVRELEAKLAAMKGGDDG